MSRRRCVVVFCMVVISVSVYLLVTTRPRNVSQERKERRCSDKSEEVAFPIPDNLTILTSWSPQQLEILYQRCTSMIQTLCPRTIRVGNKGDGGWDLCEGHVISTNCLVYSFGINFDYSFDDDMSTFGCEVHSFDPSMKNVTDYKRRDGHDFHAIGLASFNGSSKDGRNWPVRTIQGIRAELNHTQKFPDVIKIDVEGWEWHILPEMISTNQLPIQLVIEFHLENVGAAVDSDYWIQKIQIFRTLYDKGYRIFWLQRNVNCIWRSRLLGSFIYGCHEISFIRKSANK